MAHTAIWNALSAISSPLSWERLTNVTDATKNLMSMLNSSTTFDPTFWLDHRSGNHYFVGVTYKEQDIDSINAIGMVPVSGAETSEPVQLQNLVKPPTIGESAVEVNHLALGRIVNVYASADGRDIGAVARDIERVLALRFQQVSRCFPPLAKSSGSVF